MTLVALVFSIGVLAAAVYHNSLVMAIAGSTFMFCTMMWVLVLSAFTIAERATNAKIVASLFGGEDEEEGK